jgi:hypothetical protein
MPDCVDIDQIFCCGHTGEARFHVSLDNIACQREGVKYEPLSIYLEVGPPALLYPVVCHNCYAHPDAMKNVTSEESYDPFAYTLRGIVTILLRNYEAAKVDGLELKKVLETHGDTLELEALDALFGQRYEEIGRTIILLRELQHGPDGRICETVEHGNLLAALIGLTTRALHKVWEILDEIANHIPPEVLEKSGPADFGRHKPDWLSGADEVMRHPWVYGGRRAAQDNHAQDIVNERAGLPSPAAERYPADIPAFSTRAPRSQDAARPTGLNMAACAAYREEPSAADRFLSDWNYFGNLQAHQRQHLSIPYCASPEPLDNAVPADQSDFPFAEHPQMDGAADDYDFAVRKLREMELRAMIKSAVNEQASASDSSRMGSTGDVPVAESSSSLGAFRPLRTLQPPPGLSPSPTRFPPAGPPPSISGSSGNSNDSDVGAFLADLGFTYEEIERYIEHNAQDIPESIIASSPRESTLWERYPGPSAAGYNSINWPLELGPPSWSGPNESSSDRQLYEQTEDVASENHWAAPLSSSSVHSVISDNKSGRSTTPTRETLSVRSRRILRDLTFRCAKYQDLVLEVLREERYEMISLLDSLDICFTVIIGLRVTRSLSTETLIEILCVVKCLLSFFRGLGRTKKTTRFVRVPRANGTTA